MLRLLALALILFAAAPAAAQTVKTQGALQTELGTSCSAQGLGAGCINPAKLGDLIVSAVPAVATVAAAGSSQGTATVLTTLVTLVTPAAAGTGVELPAPVAGQRYAVVNQGANQLAIYPASGVAIDGLAANAPVMLAAGSTAVFLAGSSSAESSVP
jgi:hypothetical protein